MEKNFEKDDLKSRSNANDVESNSFENDGGIQSFQPPMPLQQSISPVQKKEDGKEEFSQEKSIGQFSLGGDDRPSDLPSKNTGHAFQLKENQSSTNGLPSSLNSKLESTLEHDFSNVNIHQNSTKATDVGALAYTQGQDVHFAPGQFKPDTASGQKLIGHELTHVVQQSQGRVKPTTKVGGTPVNDDKGLEAEADNMGAKIVQGKFDQPFQLKHINTKSEVAQRFEMPQWMQDSAEWVGDRVDDAGEAISDVGDAALEAILDGIETLEDLITYLATVSVSMARRVLEAIYRRRRTLLVDFITFNPTHALITIVLDIVSTEDIVKALEAMGSAALARFITFLHGIEEMARISAALAQLSAEALMNMIKHLSDELVRTVIFANEVLIEVLKKVVDEVWPVGVGLDFQAGIGATFGYPIYVGGEGECYVQHHTRNGFKLYKRGKLRVGADTGVGAGAFFGSGKRRGGNDAQTGMEWGIGAQAGAQAEAGLQIEAIQEFEFPIYEDFAFLSFVLAASGSEANSMLMTLATLGRVNLNPMQYNTRSQLSGGIYAGASAEAFAGLSLGGQNTQRGSENAGSWRNTDEQRPDYGSAENAPWYSWRSLVRKLSASANGQLRLEGNVGVEMKNENFSVNQETNQREPGTVKLSLFAQGTGAINLNAAFPFINIPLLNQDNTLGVKFNFEFTRGNGASNGQEEPNMSYKGYNIYHQSGNTESLDGASSETSIESIGDISAIMNFDEYLGNLNSVERSGTMSIGSPFGRSYLRNTRRQQGVRTLLGNNYGTSANNSRGSRPGQTQTDWGGNLEGQLLYKFKIKRQGLFAIFKKAYELFQQNFSDTDAWQRLVSDVQGIFTSGTVPSYLTELIDFAIPHIEMKELKVRVLASVGVAGGAHAAEGAKVRLHGNVQATYFRDYDILSELGLEGGFTSDELRELISGQAARITGQGGE